MNKSSILILSLIVFALIAYYIYYTFFDSIYNKRIHPLIDSFHRKNVNKQSNSDRSITKRCLGTYFKT